MDVKALLKSAGFDRVLLLDARECGAADRGALVLAFWPYQAEEAPDASNAWIHPYYDASQRAYEAASGVVKAHQAEGLSLRDDIRVKPVFARMPGFTQGRNTLTYTQAYGSRFHVQILLLDAPFEPDLHLEQESHGLHCGDCHRCESACPTHALEGGQFHRERCLRNWQLGGQAAPEEIRSQMGNRLIGCDVCQRVCPHNAPPKGERGESVPLSELLDNPKAAALALRPRIGANLAIPNRVLAQACLIAGCSQRAELLPALEKLQSHLSKAVSAHAEWACQQIRMKHL